MRRRLLVLPLLAFTVAALEPAAEAQGVKLTGIRFPQSLTKTTGPKSPPSEAPLTQVVVFEFSGKPVIASGIANGLRITVGPNNNSGQPVGQFAFGTFRVKGNSVVFTPRLPTDPLPPSFGPASDAGDIGLPGLLPDTTYEIDVAVGTPNSVQNLTGIGKGVNLPIEFTTVGTDSDEGLFSNAPDAAPKLKKKKVSPKSGTSGLDPNLFSDPAGLFANVSPKKKPPFKLHFKGPLDPSAENVSTDNIRVRAVQTNTGVVEDVVLDAAVVLVKNDVKKSEVHVFPDGVLPFGHEVVVEVSNKLRSLSGGVDDPTPDPAKFKTAARYRVAKDPMPGLAIDDVILEDFTSNDRQDTSVVLAGDQLASWDTLDSNTLRSSFGFGGDGSLGRFLPPAQNFTIILDTDFQQLPLFSGATPDVQAGTIIEGGVFHFTDFVLPPNVTLRGEGSNPLVITATGDVTIEGSIDVRGRNGINDQTFNSSVVPVAGGQAGAGGGRGGQGHPVTVPAGAPSLTFMQTPKFGGNGYAPGNVVPAGGGGGQSGCTVPWSNFNGDNGLCAGTFADQGDGSRGSGGGGGSFAVVAPTTGADAGKRFSGRLGGIGIAMNLPITWDPSKPPASPPQAYLGDPDINAVAKPNPNPLLVEATLGLGLIYGNFQVGGPTSAMNTRRATFGGDPGTPVFVDDDFGNDFFGPGGERLTIVGGQGGGGGGTRTEGLDLRCLPTTLFAGNPLTYLDAKGGGGGGAGGAILFQALGAIRFLGPNAAILADGGQGGGGEAIGASDAGGGGGGGSGGAVILQSATNVEMNDPALGTFTFGGQTRPRIVLDVSAGAGENAEKHPATGQNGIVGTHADALQFGDGGAGGPGIVQIHVPQGAPDLIDEERIWALAYLNGNDVRPAGSAQPNGATILQPLVPREKTPTPLTSVSVAQSTWYDLGAVTSEFRPPILSGDGILPGPVFGTPGLGPFFKGTDPQTGFVTTNAAGQVVNAFTNDLDVDSPDLFAPDFIPNGPVHFQTVRVLFEGADDDPDNPGSPDLDTSTGFVADVSLLNGRRHLRWRIEFDIAAADGDAVPMPSTPLPQVNFLRIPVKY